MSTSKLYDEKYYKEYFGIPDYCTSKTAIAAAKNAATKISQVLHPNTSLDVGCACGHLVKVLRELGVDAFGIDVSEYAISNAPESMKKYFSVLELPEKELPKNFLKKYDLVTCIEVLEHIPEAKAADAIAAICSWSDTVLFSSSPEESAEEEFTHVNVRPRSYWATLFAAQGFYPDYEILPDFISAQAIIFRKKKFDTRFNC